MGTDWVASRISWGGEGGRVAWFLPKGRNLVSQRLCQRWWHQEDIGWTQKQNCKPEGTRKLVETPGDD